MEEKPTGNKYIYIQNKKKTQQKEFAGPANRPRPPMTIGAAAPLAAASSSQLDCCADGEKCHSSLPLPIEETHCGRVVPCSLFYIIYFLFFPRLSILSSNIFLRHIKISQPNYFASFYAQSVYCKFSFLLTSSQRKKERAKPLVQSNSFPVSVATTHFELYRPNFFFF